MGIITPSLLEFYKNQMRSLIYITYINEYSIIIVNIIDELWKLTCKWAIIFYIFKVIYLF